ncbi:hypothetical protein FO519_001599 [Halicephalobus sp. NKZ332]|nr:hypothetical protein FO519_001599 [Halicephalobus sp. NKZ332]
MNQLLAVFLVLFFVRNQAETPVVITTWGNTDFQSATQKAIDRLKTAPNHRLLALVEGLTECEARQCDTTVGFGGSPDESGETTLDALLMDGPKKKMGAVGDLRKIKSAAKVAWAVMNHTKHSFIVGNQATKFAISMGFSEEDLTTDVSSTMHKSWLEARCQPNYWVNVEPDPQKTCGPYKPSIVKGKPEKPESYKETFTENSHDTIGMVVIDSDSNIAAGTSTNGARNKIAGRVGDSPIPGAGAYVDNEVGGAAATGDGDIMMRFLPSFLAVEKMKSGTNPTKAAEIAVLRIKQYYPNYFGAVIAANRNGDHGAACNGMKTFSYVVGRADEDKVKVYTVNCI